VEKNMGPMCDSFVSEKRVVRRPARVGSGKECVNAGHHKVPKNKRTKCSTASVIKGRRECTGRGKIASKKNPSTATSEEESLLYLISENHSGKPL